MTLLGILTARVAVADAGTKSGGTPGDGQAPCERGEPSDRRVRGSPADHARAAPRFPAAYRPARSKLRYCTASLTCAGSMRGAAARSAMVRATRRMRW